MKFQDNLRAAMRMQNVSSRDLARRWHPENPETYRRSIMRYTAGTVTPSPEIRDQLADALGVAPSVLPLPSDAHELEILADLMAALDRVRQIEDRLLSHDSERRTA